MAIRQDLRDEQGYGTYDYVDPVTGEQYSVDLDPTRPAGAGPLDILYGQIENEIKTRERLQQKRKATEESYDAFAEKVPTKWGRAAARGVASASNQIGALVTRAYEGAEAGDEVVHQAQAISSSGDRLAKKGLEYENKYVRNTISGVTESLTHMWFGLSTGGALGGTAMGGIIAEAALTSGNEAFTQARDAGQHGKALEHAAKIGFIEGGITAAFNATGFGGAEAALLGRHASTGVMKTLAKHGISELTEEQAIMLTSALTRVADNVDPKALDMDRLTEDTIQTTLSTLATVGTIESRRIPGGVRQGVQSVRDAGLADLERSTESLAGVDKNQWRVIAELAKKDKVSRREYAEAFGYKRKVPPAAQRKAEIDEAARQIAAVIPQGEQPTVPQEASPPIPDTSFRTQPTEQTEAIPEEQVPETPAEEEVTEPEETGKSAQIQTPIQLPEASANQLRQELNLLSEDEIRQRLEAQQKSPRGKFSDDIERIHREALGLTEEERPEARPETEAPAVEPVTERPVTDYSGMTVAQLKAELKGRGLKIGGKKDVLIQRLQDAEQQPTAIERTPEQLPPSATPTEPTVEQEVAETTTPAPPSATPTGRTELKAESLPATFMRRVAYEGQKPRLEEMKVAVGQPPKKNPIDFLLGLAAVDKDFRANPVMTVNSDKKLVVQDGATYTFEPEAFGFLTEDLNPGDVYQFDIADLRNEKKARAAGKKLAPKPPVPKEIAPATTFKAEVTKAPADVVMAAKGTSTPETVLSRLEEYQKKGRAAFYDGQHFYVATKAAKTAKRYTVEGDGWLKDPVDRSVSGMIGQLDTTSGYYAYNRAAYDLKEKQRVKEESAQHEKRQEERIERETKEKSRSETKQIELEIDEYIGENKGKLKKGMAKVQVDDGGFVDVEVFKDGNLGTHKRDDGWAILHIPTKLNAATGYTTKAAAAEAMALLNSQSDWSSSKKTAFKKMGPFVRAIRKYHEFNYGMSEESEKGYQEAADFIHGALLQTGWKPAHHVGTGPYDPKQWKSDYKPPEKEVRGFFGALGISIGTGKPKTERVTDIDTDKDPKLTGEHQERFVGKHGRTNQNTLWEAIKEWFGGFDLNLLVRRNRHVPSPMQDRAKQEYTAFREALRLFDEIPAVGAFQAMKMVNHYTADLDPHQFRLFELVLTMRDVVAGSERTERVPYGYAGKIDQAQRDLARLEKMAESDSTVKDALQRRSNGNRYIVKQLVKYELLPESALDNVDTYVHREILDMQGIENFKNWRAHVDPTVRAFMRKRKLAENESKDLGPQFDPNTSYLEHEMKWLSDAHERLREHVWFEDNVRKHDQFKRLNAEAKHTNYVNIVGGEANLQTLVDLREEKAKLEAIKPKDADIKARLKEIGAEIWALDPTMPWRAKMAMFVDMFQGRTEEQQEARYEDGLDPDAETISEMNRAMKDPTLPEDMANAAKGFFSALHGREVFYQEELGNAYETHQTLAEKQELQAFYPEEGTRFRTAFTVQERIVRALQDDLAAEIPISKHDLQEIEAVVHKGNPLYLRPVMATQLDSMRVPEPQNAFLRSLQWTQRQIKSVLLLYPVRYVKWRFRNLTGDAEFANAVGMGIIDTAMNDKQLRQDLQAFFNEGKSTEEIETAIEYGVMGGYIDAEIGSLEKSPLLKRLTRGKDQKLPAALRGMVAYHEWARNGAERQESYLRIAAFRIYRKALKEGKVNNYGGSMKEDVDVLVKEMGIDAAAAHLSRNLIGDYNNITVFGQWFRKYINPFWAFQEINIKRVPRIVLNAIREGKEKGQAKQVAARQTAYYSAKFATWALLRLGTLYGITWIVNNLLFPDEEDELSEDQRRQPHLVIGKNPDGTVRYLSNVSALGDFLEWFGVHGIRKRAKDVMEGKVSVGGAAANTVLAAPKKLYDGMTPMIKGIPEVAYGQSGYPDPLHPRSIPRDEALANQFGLSDELKGFKGLFLGTGERMRPYYWTQRWMWNVSDPKMNKLGRVYDAKQQYLEKNDLPHERSFRRSKAKVMRDAARHDDFKAFKAAKAVYLEEGGNYKKFRASLDALDPLRHGFNKKQREEFINEFLTAEDRENLKDVRQFAGTLSTKMYLWWKKAGGDVDVKNMEAELFSKAKLLARSRSKVEGKNAAERKEKRAKLVADQAAVVKWMRDRNISEKELVEVYLRKARESKEVGSAGRRSNQRMIRRRFRAE